MESEDAPGRLAAPAFLLLTSASRVGEQRPTRRRQIGIARFATAQTPDQVDDAQHQRGDQWSTEKGMSEAAVVGESEDWAAELGDNVYVGCFGCQGQRGGGECAFAVQSCAAQAGSGQQMGDGFQSFGEAFLDRK